MAEAGPRAHEIVAYHPASLLEAQSEETEKALWAALRALEARASLLSTCQGRCTMRLSLGRPVRDALE